MAEQVPGLRAIRTTNRERESFGTTKWVGRLADTSFVYRVMYRVGFAPWDNGRVPAALRGLIEGPEALQPGRALDVGCGTGTQSVYLAECGWQVTELAAPGATLLMMALAPNRLPVAPAGVEESEILGRFAGWRLVSAQPDVEGEISGPLRNVRQTWYQLVRG